MTLPIPQFTTSHLATHGNKMRKVIRGKVILCVITSMTRIDRNIVGFVYAADGGRGRVSCNVALFRVMLHMFLVMLQVFRLILQVFLVMLHMFPVTLQETRATLQKTRATLQETVQHYTKHVRIRRPPNTQSPQCYSQYGSLR